MQGVLIVMYKYDNVQAIRAREEPIKGGAHVCVVGDGAFTLGCIWLKIDRVSAFKTFMVAERVSQGHAPANLDAGSTTFPLSPLRAAMQMENLLPVEGFLPGFPQNMEAKMAQENFTAMIATGLALGRMLMPVDRQGLRVAWHALDRATGLWKKVETEDEFDLPENIANAVQKIQKL